MAPHALDARYWRRGWQLFTSWNNFRRLPTLFPRAVFSQLLAQGLFAGAELCDAQLVLADAPWPDPIHEHPVPVIVGRGLVGPADPEFAAHTATLNAAHRRVNPRPAPALYASPIVQTPYSLRQQAFRKRFDPWADGFGPPDATIVVLPSISFDPAELRKITGVERYEERLLCLLLLLRQPQRRMIYLTAMPVDPAVVEYYLGFLPDPESARARLTLLSPGDPQPSPLSGKLLARPDLLECVDGLLAGVRHNAYLLPFNVTTLERRVADHLNVPLYGPDPELASLGSKSGSRRTAQRAGVPVLEGREDLWSLDALDVAIAQLCRAPTGAEAVVIKLNDSFSGQGNAIVDCHGFSSSASAAPTVFCAQGEDWTSYAAKIRAGGAIVERLLSDHLIASPSAQLRVTPGGEVEVLSTHDQVLGGEHHQVYLGCRFPAGAQYRRAITEAAQRVAETLRADGVIGAFGIDFFVRAAPSGSLNVALSEINLRLGGTTHPFLMARLVSDSMYDASSGVLRDAAGRESCYVASDNLTSPRLVGTRPGDVTALLERAGLGYDAASGTGVTCHLLGALPDYGKMGITCIAPTMQAADDLYRDATAVLAAGSPSVGRLRSPDGE